MHWTFVDGNINVIVIIVVLCKLYERIVAYQLIVIDMWFVYMYNLTWNLEETL